MSSSSSRTKTRILRDVAVTPADLSQVSARVARTLVVSPELVEGALRDGRRAGYDAGYPDGLAEATTRTADLAQRLIDLVPRMSDAAEALYQREATARVQIEDQV